MMWEIIGFICAVVILIPIHALVNRTHRRCNHDWIIVKDETTQSSAEHYGKCTGYTPTPKNNYHLEEMTKRKRIIIMKCGKCGKVDKTIEVI